MSRSPVIPCARDAECETTPSGDAVVRAGRRVRVESHSGAGRDDDFEGLRLRRSPRLDVPPRRLPGRRTLPGRRRRRTAGIHRSDGPIAVRQRPSRPVVRAQGLRSRLPRLVNPRPLSSSSTRCRVTAPSTAYRTRYRNRSSTVADDSRRGFRTGTPGTGHPLVLGATPLGDGSSLDGLNCRFRPLADRRLQTPDGGSRDDGLV